MVLAIDKYDCGIFETYWLRTAKPIFKLCIIVKRF